MADRDLVTIASDQLSAAINPLGAELTHFTDAAGAELMTNADPAFWAGHAPILFPIVGALAGNTLRVDGRAYPMKQHGFARRSRFEVVEALADRATFRLCDSDDTRRVYPFAFQLDLAFAIDAATLAIMATIANPGDRPLPAQFGFHPAFAWPLPFGEPRAAHRITFAADEPGGICQLTGGLVSPAERPSPLDGRELALRDELFAADALIWNPVRSQSVRYGAGDAPHLDIRFPDTPALGIWTKPGARFVCIEPWHGTADPQGYTGEFRDKPGVFAIPPGDARRIAMTVTLAP